MQGSVLARNLPSQASGDSAHLACSQVVSSSQVSTRAASTRAASTRGLGWELIKLLPKLVLVWAEWSESAVWVDPAVLGSPQVL